MRFTLLRIATAPRIAAVGIAAAVLTGLVAPGASSAAPLPSDDAIAVSLKGRLAAADAYAATRPGTVGIVVVDRVTGAVMANRYADTPVWTASTIKLAVATDLLRRQRAGTVHLSNADRADMHEMLNSSDDAATDRLWFAYAGRDHRTFNRDFRALG